MRRTALFLGVAVLFHAAVASAAEVSVRSMPPVVVKTLPEAGDTAVDPATAEIRVTFSKPMQDKSWSWTQMSNETFPEGAGQPHYLADKRTCVLPVKLAPGRTYVLWLNSNKFHNFKDAKGQPAVPYLLVFETSSRRAQAAAQGSNPDDAESIRKTIEQFFAAMEDRDSEEVVNAFHTAAIAVEAANPNANVQVFDLTKPETLLPPKGNDDWQGVTVSDVKVETSETAPSVATASFTLNMPEFEQNFERMRAQPMPAEIRAQMSDEQRKMLDRVLAGENPKLTMFTLMAKRQGQWKIVALTLPK